MAEHCREEISHRICVVTVTYYPDTSDIRFRLTLELCKLATRQKIHLIIVDGSPDPTVRYQFQAGADGYVHVIQQDKEQYSGKGGALRQAVLKATEWIRENNATDSGHVLREAAICFTEPEKVD